MASKQHAHLLSLARGMIPPLHPKLHKGQAGRIGVLGGSGDYSGAPYFSSMGAMRFGADLAHVICEPSAGAVIKTYSPDLIVHTILDPQKSREDIRSALKGVMSRLHVLIIGPGLGRDDHMQSCAKIAFELAKDMEQMGVVVDADGLWLVQNEPKVVMDWPGVPRIILTPNVMEFKRLCDTMLTLMNYQKIDSSGPHTSLCPQLATALGNATIIQKGPSDIISNGLKLPSSFLSDESEGERNYLEVKVEGGLKRVGGQGDILSGSTGVLLAWGSEWVRGSYKHVGHPPPQEKAIAENIPVLAAYGASTFNRTVSKRGFQKKGRSMVTGDLVDMVGDVYEEVFGNPGEMEGRGKL
ncbi:ATP-dependent (S)-NAD(P)H-hydrate dehydratase [Cryptococcus gattii Ru294]|uniref:ATP-dependent (S)-NAD(P)H-hydrate dehydratase n=2 Tax=Cryptococcus gattii TaxID=37769 RepID=E6R5M0_CRYGW|nr:Cytoplasm protein, putative [Cryptococcus gattii WM276]KIR53957.1 ATP-dependent (S)-NAD(P)H-hydrate dehydratase [Cryptococcus gattii Ru294]KIR80991.1 ATP-dependent (S)-NAD(P)H-hydrate dehydratase [Cryptococcus gattii EJB2]KIY34045.1 ATP-dependent (S)-NAD(P)H-hydrate dehydratase [Cryptococcus gattii E566]KJE02954.1 ATP-dependent (S)-NAD(P)H-hydrate dehydratase [Cryptococcus gattii NT-10]ADV21550.1 Cytoplasm protein, putative [Cryptococcus gattii WM276]